MGMGNSKSRWYSEESYTSSISSFVPNNAPVRVPNNVPVRVPKKLKIPIFRSNDYRWKESLFLEHFSNDEKRSIKMKLPVRSNIIESNPRNNDDLYHFCYNFYPKGIKIIKIGADIGCNINLDEFTEQCPLELWKISHKIIWIEIPMGYDYIQFVYNNIIELDNSIFDQKDKLNEHFDNYIRELQPVLPSAPMLNESPPAYDSLITNLPAQSKEHIHSINLYQI